MNKNKKNAGFTLVEIIIAITVLTICVIPLLRSFVMAAQINHKAKESLNATNVAQNIMEDIKTQGVEKFAGLGAPNYDVDGDGSNESYSISYSNYEMNSKSYKVDMIMSPSAAGVKNPINPAIIDEFNNQNLGEIRGMDQGTDAIYVEDPNRIMEVAAEYKRNHSEVALSQEQIADNITVSYGFEIKKVMGQKAYVMQNIVYNYGTNEIERDQRKFYDSLQSGQDFKSLYVFFVKRNRNNQVVIVNSDNLAVDFYLIEQDTGVETGKTKLSIQESVPAPVTSNIKMRTNMLAGDFSSIEYNFANKNYQYLKNAFHLKELGKTDEVQKRLYDIKITVKDFKTDGELTTLKGNSIK